MQIYKVRKIMDLLKSGSMIYVKGCNMWVKDRLICWNCYGSSANPKTLRDLEWILDNIAKATDSDSVYINEDRLVYLKPRLTEINFEEN